MKSAALFDADGTLLDTMASHRALAADCVVRHFRSDGLDQEAALGMYDRTTGKPFPQQLLELFPGDANYRHRVRCAEEYMARKGGEVYGQAPAFADARACVQELAGEKVPLRVSSSTEREHIARALEREGLLPYLDGIWGYEDGRKSAHVPLARKRFQADAVFFVDDSPAVMPNLVAAGAIAVGRAGTGPGMHSPEELLKAGARYALSDLRELPGILRSLPR